MVLPQGQSSKTQSSSDTSPGEVSETSSRQKGAEIQRVSKIEAQEFF